MATVLVASAHKLPIGRRHPSLDDSEASLDYIDACPALSPGPGSLGLGSSNVDENQRETSVRAVAARPNHVDAVATRRAPPGAAPSSSSFQKMPQLSLIHISEPTRRTPISYAV